MIRGFYSKTYVSNRAALYCTDRGFDPKWNYFFIRITCKFHQIDDQNWVYVGYNYLWSQQKKDWSGACIDYRSDRKSVWFF